jgi:hypothetical protein
MQLIFPCRVIPPSLKDNSSRLESVEVLFFDILGTMLDWYGTVTRALKRQADRFLPEGSFHPFAWDLLNIKVFTPEIVDWGFFASQWRNGYMVALYVVCLFQGTVLVTPFQAASCRVRIYSPSRHH